MAAEVAEQNLSSPAIETSTKSTGVLIQNRNLDISKMMNASSRLPIIPVLMALITMPAHAGVFTIEPFNGTLTENWEAFSTDIHMSSPISIMGGQATASGRLLYVYRDRTVSNGSGFLGVSDGTKAIQVAGVTVSFNEPVYRFGAYWNCYDIRPSMTIDFYDSGGILIDTATFARPLGANLGWQGWESSIPIGKVVLRGEGGVEAMDGLQAAIPEPLATVSWASLGLLAAALCSRPTNSKR